MYISEMLTLYVVIEIINISIYYVMIRKREQSNNKRIYSNEYNR